MNSIEANKIADVDKALDYIIPAAIPSIAALSIKMQLKNLLEDKYLIDKANKIYFSANTKIYLDFFLKFLLLGNENGSLITIDNNSIALATIFNQAEHKQTFAPGSLNGLINNIDESVWLSIYRVKNFRLKRFLDCWTMSPIHKSDDNTYHIQLFPATTCNHLDELYRVFCTYL